MACHDSRDVMLITVISRAVIEFVNHHGGIERIWGDIWGHNFCTEYIRCVDDGIKPATAAKRADRLCYEKILRRTYEEGFLDETGKHFKCCQLLADMAYI